MKWWILAASIAAITMGCTPAQQAQMRPVVHEPSLIAAGKICGPKDGKPLLTPELVENGNAVRDAGLVILAAGGDADDLGQTLATAADCYSRALALAPDSYEASLGLGVTYLARVRASDKDSITRDAFL